MDFWSNRINVGRAAAERQVEIIKGFTDEKRMGIALDFAGLGVARTREWIKERHPGYSDLEVSLEWVRLMYYEHGEMPEDKWLFFETEMKKKIRKDWSDRFRAMMRENGWAYDDLAEMGDFKSGKVIEATVSRGLPSFAKLLVNIYETQKNKARP